MVIASLLMSLESVFSVLAGWVVLHQVLSFKEIVPMDASEGADGLVATGDIKSLDDLTDFFELVK